MDLLAQAIQNGLMVAGTILTVGFGFGVLVAIPLGLYQWLIGALPYQQRRPLSPAQLRRIAAEVEARR